MSSSTKRLRTALQTTLHGTDSWRLSTWLMPVVFQGALGIFIAVSWLLANCFSALGSMQNVFLLATVITTVAAAAPAYLMMRSTSTRARCIGLSAAGSAAAVLVGGITFTMGITILWHR